MRRAGDPRRRRSPCRRSPCRRAPCRRAPCRRSPVTPSSQPCYLRRMSALTPLRRLLLALAFALPLAASAQNAFTTQAVNMRAGPDRSFPLVAWIPAGAAVQVFGCLDGWRWCDTAWGPHRGWVWSQTLQTTFQNQPWIIFHGGPTLGIPLVTFSIGAYWDSFYRNRPWWDHRDYWFHRPPPPPPPAWRPPPPGWHPPPAVRPPPPAVRPPPPPGVRPPPRPTPPPSVTPPPRPMPPPPGTRPPQPPNPPPSVTPPPRPMPQPPASSPGSGPRPPAAQPITRPPRPQ